jgi:hypothetical protein
MDPFSLLSSILSILDSGLGILSRIFGGDKNSQPPNHAGRDGGNQRRHFQQAGHQPYARQRTWHCYYLKIENRGEKPLNLKLKYRFYSPEERDWLLSPEIFISIESGESFILQKRQGDRIPTTFIKYFITNTGNWLQDIQEYQIWLDRYPYQAAECQTYVLRLE